MVAVVTMVLMVMKVTVVLMVMMVAVGSSWSATYPNVYFLSRIIILPEIVIILQQQ